MKIVFLHHANYCKGGIERMLAMKADYLADRMGWDVVLLTYEQNGEAFPYSLSARVRQVDLNVHLYSAYRFSYPLRYLKKLLLCRQLVRALRTFLSAERPDLVVCTDKDSHELNALYQAHTTEKLVVEAHTGMVDHEFQVVETRNRLRRLIGRKDVWRLKQAVARFDLLVALTADMLGRLSFPIV